MEAVRRQELTENPAKTGRNGPRITLDPALVTSVLASVAIMLILAGSVGQYLRFGLGYDHAFGLVRLFDLDSESNIPTWYSSCLLLLAAALLGIFAAAGRGHEATGRRPWTALAVIFLYLSIDETAQIHESFYRPLNKLLGPRISNLVEATWTIPAGLIVLALGLLFWRFVRQLPRATRRLFILAGGLYLFGAIGVELLGHQQKRLHGTDNPLWSLSTIIEEGFEMGGCLVFIYALLLHLERHVGAHVVQFGRPKSQPRQEKGRA